MNPIFIKAKLCEILHLRTVYTDVAKLVAWSFPPENHLEVIDVLSEMWYEGWLLFIGDGRARIKLQAPWEGVRYENDRGRKRVRDWWRAELEVLVSLYQKERAIYTPARMA